MTLGEYLKWSVQQPWGWGTAPGLDCCKFVGKWVICCGHLDPMVLVWGLPGQYDSQISALRVIKQGGGLRQLWAEGMAHVGVPEADSPEAGDVAVLQAPTEDGLNEACGIWTGERWAILGQRGMIFGPADVIGLWRP